MNEFNVIFFSLYLSKKMNEIIKKYLIVKNVPENDKKYLNIII